MEAEARGEARLLAAVVAMAIRDACIRPSGKPPVASDIAINAVDFLFRTDVAGLGAYGDWLEFDAVVFRQRLKAAVESERFERLSDGDMRAFRFNYRALKDGAPCKRGMFEEPAINAIRAASAEPVLLGW